MSDQVWMAIRYTLIGVGMFLVGAGYVHFTLDQVTGFIDKAQPFIGAIVAVGSAVWGMYVKWNTRSVPPSTAARVDVPTINPVTGATIPGSASVKP